MLEKFRNKLSRVVVVTNLRAVTHMRLSTKVNFQYPAMLSHITHSIGKNTQKSFFIIRL